MKLLLLFLGLLIASTQVKANEAIYCQGIQAVQDGVGVLQQESEFRFNLERSSKENVVITNLTGFFNVKSPFTEGETITSENGYRGQFATDEMVSNPNYRPLKYLNWTQFKKLDAVTTDSLEHGMWGYLVLDLSSGDSFQGRYIYQAGTHMGGVLSLTCEVVP